MVLPVLGTSTTAPGHQLFQDRYETWDELYTYCYRVAGTVGLMVLPVLGTSTTHAGGGHPTRTQSRNSLPDHEHPQRCGGRCSSRPNILTQRRHGEIWRHGGADHQGRVG